jgi:hypothetical protein
VVSGGTAIVTVGTDAERSPGAAQLVDEAVQDALAFHGVDSVEVRRADGDGPPVLLRHEGCGQETELTFTCSSCGRDLTARDVRAVRGPGAGGASPFPPPS